MTYLQALYGSQYSEIAARGKDGNKGRFNGNVFLSAFIILIIFDVLLLWVTFVPGANEMFNNDIHSLFGYLSGKTVGQFLAIPLFAIIYFAIMKTVGSEPNFKKNIEAFNQLPEPIKAKANKKLLVPFLLLVALLFILAMSSLVEN